MFYYPDVLKRRTGCFSTIWLVATKGIKVPRRDFLKVNVKSTCDDIMDYLMERVPPPRPGLPRPRFSLYLSSQLQYGVIVVYHRQCDILLEDLQTIVGRLAKQRTSQKIDMDYHNKQALLFPDALSLLEEAEGALDPLFGVMQFQDVMPSPSTLIQMAQEFMRGASPEQPELTSPAAPLEDSMTASPDTITLREREPVTIPTAEFEGADLADHHPDIIDFLLAQTDDFPEGDMEIGREGVTAGEGEREMEREREGREGDMEREKTKELTGSTIELQPTILSSEDAMVLPQEEPGLPVEEPGPPTEEVTPEEVTPVSVPVAPSPSGAEERERRQKRPSPTLEYVPAPEVRRRRRKRQLTFFDPETQLSQDVLQQQINDPRAETKHPLLPPPPSHRMLPASDLLNKPCIFLPEELQLLWRRAATITPLSGSDLQVGERGPDSTDSDRERERERARTAQIEQERHELSSKEGSDQRELSREISPMGTPESKGSPVSRSVSRLQDIPEEVEAALEVVAGESPEAEPGPGADLPGTMPELAEHMSPVLFHSLLPPEVDRRTVTNIFWRLLENVSTRKLCVEQDEPYGDIRISPGPNYEQEGLFL
ncbi:meiotic recombination protein REC8 homolog [Centroberyx affinis]|uniref:meiotic recombination protein REC8 homolog n=1 Tax=Centroberyx affinis TaxID=166261 RepID=UPI003A5C2C02